MAKHGGSCVHFSGISTCGRTSRETVPHPQRQPLLTPYKIALLVYVTVTNKRLQLLTITLYNTLVLSFSLLKISRRLIKHRSFLRALRSWGERSLLCRRGCRSTTSSSSNTLLPHIHVKACLEVYAIKCHTHTHKQRVLIHRHQGWNVRHGLCHIYMRYLYIYELFIAFVCFVVCSLL